MLIVYRCGSDSYWSRVLHFVTMKDDVNWSPRLAVFGDLGVENAKSVPMLSHDAQNSLYDAIIHIGDFAYNMDSVIDC